METNAENHDAPDVPATKGILSFDVGIVHLAYCLMRLPEPPKTRRRKTKGTDANAITAGTGTGTGTILAWDILCLAEDGEKAKRIPLDLLGSRLFQKLDDLWVRLNGHIQTVLIENQPSRLNGHMKSVQMMIYTYFLYKKSAEHPIDVRLINACGKLKTHDIALRHLPETDKEGYKWNKWASIQIANYYLRNATEWKQRLEKEKKKDDLCDAFLQGLAWFHKTYKCELGEIGDPLPEDLNDHWGHSYTALCQE